MLALVIVLLVLKSYNYLNLNTSSLQLFNTFISNIPVSSGLTTLAQMLNGYEMCLNAKIYPIGNMQDFTVYLHFGLFWSAGIPTVNVVTMYSVKSASTDEHVRLLSVTSFLGRTVYKKTWPTWQSREMRQWCHRMSCVMSGKRSTSGGHSTYIVVYLCSDFKGMVFGILCPFSYMLFIVYCPF